MNGTSISTDRIDLRIYLDNGHKKRTIIIIHPQPIDKFHLTISLQYKIIDSLHTILIGYLIKIMSNLSEVLHMHKVNILEAGVFGLALVIEGINVAHIFEYIIMMFKNILVDYYNLFCHSISKYSF